MTLSSKMFMKVMSSGSLAFLSFVGFVLALVNTSILHDECGTGENCDNFFRRFWWTLMFQFSIKTTAFLTWMTGIHRTARVAIVGFLVLVTTQLIDLTGLHITALDTKVDWPINDNGQEGNDWIEKSPLKSSLAGYLILAFTNMVYMLILGMDEAPQEATGKVTAPPAETACTSKPEEGAAQTQTETVPPV
eukprot:g7955.t1